MLDVFALIQIGQESSSSCCHHGQRCLGQRRWPRANYVLAGSIVRSRSDAPFWSCPRPEVINITPQKHHDQRQKRLESKQIRWSNCRRISYLSHRAIWNSTTAFAVRMVGQPTYCWVWTSLRSRYICGNNIHFVPYFPCPPSKSIFYLRSTAVV